MLGRRRVLLKVLERYGLVFIVVGHRSDLFSQGGLSGQSSWKQQSYFLVGGGVVGTRCWVGTEPPIDGRIIGIKRPPGAIEGILPRFSGPVIRPKPFDIFPTPFQYYVRSKDEQRQF